MTKFINLNSKDGTYCVGCNNKNQITNQCKLKHITTSIGGCRECGHLQRTEIIMGILEKCLDYVPDPNFWQKDSYG